MLHATWTLSAYMLITVTPSLRHEQAMHFAQTAHSLVSEA